MSADPIYLLLQNLGSCPRFTREEEASLAARMRAGDVDARRQLAASCAAYAVKLAGHYFKIQSDVLLADMIGWAFLGLCECLDKFDPDKGRLTTYSGWYIRRSCTRAIAGSDRLIHTPHYLSSKKCRGGNWEELSELARRSRHRHKDVSDLEPGIRESLMVFDDVHERMEIEDDVEKMSQCLRSLTETQRQVLELRIYQDMTLAEIGEILGVTRERVRQIEEKSLSRLRKMMTESTRV